MKNESLNQSQIEALRFLSAMALELQQVASENHLALVRYFLEMASVEIGDTLRVHEEKTRRLRDNAETPQRIAG